MKSENLEKLVTQVQKHMAEDSSPCAMNIERKLQGDQRVEAAALAMMIEAYLFLSTHVNPEYSSEFFRDVASNIDEIAHTVIHGGSA